MKKTALRPHLPIFILAALCAAPACAESTPLAQALEESAEAVGASAELGVKASSAVVALPVSAVGAVSLGAGTLIEAAGAGSAAVGEETLEAGEAAYDYAVSPLTVGDDVIVAAPAPDVPFSPRDAADADAESDAGGDEQ